MNLIDTPSPNHDSRSGTPVDMLVLHYTGMPTAAGALEKLTDPTPGKRVSAHYLVDEMGAVHRLVPENERAWHAGVSSWRGAADVNACSIGIEIANPGHDHGYNPFPPAQMAAVAELCQGILARHPIPAWNVVAHSDIAPARKQDPGELFDWKGLAEQGIGLWPAAHTNPLGEAVGWVMRLFGLQGEMLMPGSSGPKVLAMQQKLAQFGYNCPQCSTYGNDTKTVVEAFQRHYRQAKVDGVWDGECNQLLGSLLAKVPSATVTAPDGRMAASALR